MKLLEHPEGTLADEPPQVPVVIIPDARRRGKSRHVRIGLVVGLMLAVAATIGGLVESRGSGTPNSSRAFPESLPASVASELAHTSLLLRPPGALPAGLWPPGVGSASMPNVEPVLVEELGTGHLSVRVLPGTERPTAPELPILDVGRFVVYRSGAGISAVASDFKGRARLLGRASSFAPSAAPGQVWLVRSAYPFAATSIQSVSVTSGSRGQVTALPRGSLIVRGTDAGLLLLSESGALELWQPGGAPRIVAHLGGPLLGDVFATDARVVAWGAGCRNAVSARGDYTVCETLRVADLVTDKRLSFHAPAGTLGWVPPPTTVSDLSSGGGKLAGGAAMPPISKYRTEEFVLSLSGRRHNVTKVPASDAQRYVRTAWSPHGLALLYQGRHDRLDVFLPASDRRYESTLPWSSASVAVVAVSRAG